MQTDRFCWWLIASLTAFQVFLAVMHVIIVWPPADTFIEETRTMFDLDQEGNLAAWFSSMQFFLLGLTSVLIYLLEKLINPARKRILIWFLCALGAVYLSADEAARIHEWAGTALGWVIEESEKGSLVHHWDRFPSYYWSLIYVPLALPAAIFLGWFFYKELGTLGILPIMGMILFVTGAVVLDFVEGAYSSFDTGQWRVQLQGFNVDTFIIEEMFEMLGVTLILAGCLFHASRLASRWLTLTSRQ